MAAPLTHRATAVKGKYLAQAAGLVLLAAAAAVWAVGLPGVKGASSELPEMEPVVLQAPPTAEGGALPESIFEDIAIGMETIANAPKPVDEAPPVVTNGDSEVPDDLPMTDEVAFVGSVISPNRRIAVLRVGDSQVWIPEGEEREGILVHEVERDQVRLERDGQDFELERAARKKGFLTTLAASSPARMPQGNGRMPPSIDPQAQAQVQAEMEAMKAAEVSGEMVSEEGTSGEAQDRMDRIRRAQERARERALRRGEQR